MSAPILLAPRGRRGTSSPSVHFPLLPGPSRDVPLNVVPFRLLYHFRVASSGSLGSSATTRYCFPDVAPARALPGFFPTTTTTAAAAAVAGGGAIVETGRSHTASRLRPPIMFLQPPLSCLLPSLLFVITGDGVLVVVVAILVAAYVHAARHFTSILISYTSSLSPSRCTGWALSPPPLLRPRYFCHRRRRRCPRRPQGHPVASNASACLVLTAPLRPMTTMRSQSPEDLRSRRNRQGATRSKSPFYRHHIAVSHRFLNFLPSSPLASLYAFLLRAATSPSPYNYHRANSRLSNTHPASRQLTNSPRAPRPGGSAAALNSDMGKGCLRETEGVDVGDIGDAGDDADKHGMCSISLLLPALRLTVALTPFHPRR